MTRLKHAILLFVALLVGIWWWHNQASETTPVSDVKTSAPLLVLSDVTSYHFTNTGVQELVLKTPKLTHFDDARGSDYQQPVINYVADDQFVRIRGNKGHLDEHKTLLTFTGDVLSEEYVNNARLRWLETTILHYHLPEKIADTDADVKITTPESLTYATGATWHVKEESFILKENVRSHYEFKNEP